MRASRSPILLLLLALTLTAGGCGWQPAPWWAGAQGMVGRPAPTVAVATPAPIAAPGIDSMVYGSVAPPAPMPAPVRVAAAGHNRGLFTSARALDFAEAAPVQPAGGVVMTAVAAPPPRYVPMPADPADAAPAQTDGGIVTTAVVPPPPPPTPVQGPPPAVQYAPDPADPIAFAPDVRDKPYTLDSGDRLRVVVFGQDGLSNSYLVDASGHIDVPLIGSVLARGATTDQLASRIADKLKDGFVKEPHVAVEIEAYRPFFILGEVTQPGQYPYVADMTVETAVAIAGGFGPRAYRRTVTVSRIVDGRHVRMTVPITYTLRPGDTVNVGERWF
jgi:polysaccharide biosynthesis/export protein